jgi:hypothetical protein
MRPLRNDPPDEHPLPFVRSYRVGPFLKMIPVVRFILEIPHPLLLYFSPLPGAAGER